MEIRPVNQNFPVISLAGVTNMVTIFIFSDPGIFYSKNEKHPVL
jgi:hypothetical protein